MKIWRKRDWGKINRCALELKGWGERTECFFKERLEKCRERMERFRSCVNSFSVQCYKEAVKEYAILLKHEEDFWKQRGKQYYWLQAGDCNWKFFHAYASTRKKKNQLLQLMDSGDLGQMVCGIWLKKFTNKYSQPKMRRWRRFWIVLKKESASIKIAV